MASVSVEVQVWDEPTYVRLVNAGADGVVVYQETYDRGTYADVHLLGKKRNYEWRLAAPDRAAAAGARRLGIGALLGLHGDWRAEAMAVAAHARELMHRWWRAEVVGVGPADASGRRRFRSRRSRRRPRVHAADLRAAPGRCPTPA